MADTSSHLTVALKMEEGRPIKATTLAKHMIAFVRALNATDKGLNGRVMCDWYLTGFDLTEEGVAYRITPFPKGAVPKIASVDHDAPPLLGRHDGTEVSNG